MRGEPAGDDPICIKSIDGNVDWLNECLTGPTVGEGAYCSVPIDLQRVEGCGGTEVELANALRSGSADQHA